MKKVEKYLIPQNIVDMWLEYQSLLNLRDLYILRPFGCGYKKAKKVAIDAEKMKAKASRAIADLYPELDKRKTWTLCDLKYKAYLEIS